MSFQDVKAIYDSLPEDQKRLVSPRGEFVDSPRLAIRTVTPEKDGYAEAYSMPGNKAFVTIAVAPDAQGKGKGLELLQQTIAKANASGISKLVYRLASSNDASRALVRKFVDKPHRTGKDWEEYIIDTANAGDPYTATLPPSVIKAVEDMKGAYKGMGYDLSDVRVKGTTRSRYESGAVTPYSVMPKEQQVGASWVPASNSVYFNPDIKAAMKLYGVKGSQDDFVSSLAAHELAHAVDQRYADDKMRKKVLKDTKDSGFTTPYLDNLPFKENRDKEVFAEWLAHKVMEKNHIAKTASANMYALEKVADINVEYVDPASMPHNSNTQEWEPVTFVGDSNYTAPKRGEMDVIGSRIGATGSGKYDIDNIKALGPAYNGASPDEVRGLIDTANMIRAKVPSVYGMSPAPYVTHVDNTADAEKRYPSLRGRNMAVFYDDAKGSVATDRPVESFVHIGGNSKTDELTSAGSVFNGYTHPHTSVNAADLKTPHTILGHEVTHVLNHAPNNTKWEFPSDLSRVYDNHQAYAKANNFDVGKMGGTTYNATKGHEALQSATHTKRLAYGLFRERHGRLPGLGVEDDPALRDSYIEAGRRIYNTEQMRGAHELSPAGEGADKAAEGYNKNYGRLIDTLMKRDKNGYRQGDALVNRRNDAGSRRLYKLANMVGLEKTSNASADFYKATHEAPGPALLGEYGHNIGKVFHMPRREWENDEEYTVRRWKGIINALQGKHVDVSAPRVTIKP